MKNLCLALVLSSLALPASADGFAGQALAVSQEISPGHFQSGWALLITPAGQEKVKVDHVDVTALEDGEVLIIEGKAYVILGNPVEIP